MKIRNLFYLLVACLMVSMSFSSCNDDDPQELILGVSKLYAKVGRTATILAVGNGGYTIEVDKPEILTATINEQGVITLTPLKIGTAKITVKDSELKEKPATIEVVDPYLAFYVIENEISVKTADEAIKKDIEKTVKDSLVFEDDHIYEFILNEQKIYNVYKENWSTSKVSSGTYVFDVEKKNFTMESGIKESTLTPEQNNNFAKIFYDYFTTDNKEPEYTSDANSTFTLSEDLVEKYKRKHPEANVEEVKVTIKAGLLPSHKFEFKY